MKKKMILLVTIVISLACNASSQGVLKYSEYGSHTTDLASRISTGDFSPANCSVEEYTRFAVQLFSEKLPELGISTIGHVQWMVENSDVVMMPLSDYDRYTTPGSCKNSVVENGTMSWSANLRPLSNSERIKYKNGVPCASYEGLIWLNLICWNIIDIYQPVQVPSPVPYQGEGSSEGRGAIINNYYITNEGQTVVYQQEATGYQNGYSQSWGSPSGVNVSLWFSWGNYQNSCQVVQNYCQPPVQCCVTPVQTCVPYQQCPTAYLWQNLHSNVYAGCTTTPVHDNGGNGPNGDSDGDLPGNGPSKTIYQGNHPKTETVTGRSFEVPKGITSVSNDVSQSGTKPSVSVKPSFASPSGINPRSDKGNTYASIIGNTPKGNTVNPGYSESSVNDTRPNNSFVSPIKNPGVRPGKEVSTNSSSANPRTNNMGKGNNNGITSYVPPPRTKNNANYTSDPRNAVGTEQARPQNNVNHYSAPRPRANAQQARPRNNSSQMARGNTGSRPSNPSVSMARGGTR